MDTWEDGGTYDGYMGRWSRHLADEFVRWLGVPVGSRWIDVGCGTGALAEAIAQSASPESVAGIDPSPGFIAAARMRVGDGADLRVGDAQSLPFDDASFDAAASAIALNFVPDPGLAVRDMARVVAKGGVVATYLWDYAEGMEMIRLFWDAAVALDPSIAHLDEAIRFPLCNPERLVDLFGMAGLVDLEATSLEVPTVFEDFDAYWRPMLGDQGPIPTYVGSLGATERLRLEHRLRDQLPTSGDGSIALRARAWAVRGTVR